LDGCLLGGRSAAVDPRVVRDEIGIVVALFLVFGDQPAGPRVRAVGDRGKQHRHQPDTHRRQRAQNHPPASPKRKT